MQGAEASCAISWLIWKKKCLTCLGTKREQGLELRLKERIAGIITGEVRKRAFWDSKPW